METNEILEKIQQILNNSEFFDDVFFEGDDLCLIKNGKIFQITINELEEEEL